MMTRDSRAGRWMTTRPVGLIAALLLTAAGGLGWLLLDTTYRWQPLQRYYTLLYVTTGFSAHYWPGEHNYKLLMMQKPKGVGVFMRTVDVVGLSATGVTPAAHVTNAGFTSFGKVTTTTTPAAVHELMRTDVYDGASALMMFLPVLIATALTALAVFIVGIRSDIKRRRARRAGTVVRGRDIISNDDWNKGWEAH